MVPVPLVFLAAILGNPFLGTKYQSSITQQREKNSKGHKCYTFKYLWECQSTTWKSNDSTRSWTHTLPWHINPPIICITFDLKTCLIIKKKRKGESWEKFPKVSLEWWAEGLFTFPGWNTSKITTVWDTPSVKFDCAYLIYTWAWSFRAWLHESGWPC